MGSNSCYASCLSAGLQREESGAAPEYHTNFIWAYSDSAIALPVTVIEKATGQSLQVYGEGFLEIQLPGVRYKKI